MISTVPGMQHNLSIQTANTRKNTVHLCDLPTRNNLQVYGGIEKREKRPAFIVTLKV